jgi:hypothetical protein
MASKKKPWEDDATEVASADPATSKKPWEDFSETPTAESEDETALISPMGGLKAAAKVLDTPRAAIGAPALAGVLELLSGKDVFRGKEWANAMNPTKYNTFPDSATLFERAGVPEGGKLSDIAPSWMYAQPGEGGTFTPEVGGMLDPTIRGTSGFATDALTDPLTYLSMGGNQAAKALVKESASMAAHKAAKSPGMISKGIDFAMTPLTRSVEGAGQITNQALEKLKNSPMGQRLARAATAVSTAPSAALKMGGKRLYNSPLLDLEHEGEVLGKSGIGESLYNAGIWNPFKLDKQVDSAVSRLGNARKKIYNAVDEAGYTVQPEKLFAQAEAEIKSLRDSPLDTDWALADKMEAQVNRMKQDIVGTPEIPGTPASKRQVSTGVLDAQGRPVMREEIIPGTDAIPAVPGKPMTVSRASQLKSKIYADTGDAAWNELKNSPPGKQYMKKMGQGVKESIEDTTNLALGPGKAADVAELNQEMGNLLATKKSQRKVTKNVDRLANDATNMSRLDTKILGTQAAHGEPERGILSIMLAKALGIANLGTMPTGYGMRKLGEGTLTAPAVDFVTRKGFKDMTGYNPWEAPNGEE